MQQHIGGTKIMAWVEHIMLSFSFQVKRAKELEKFTERFRSLFDLGEPLDVNTQRLMETFFGYDLEKVRLHRGQEADEASRQLGARAFTFRGHVFGPRQNLLTSSVEGLGLLAHELTHVIQQTKPRRLHPAAEISLVSAAPGGHSDVEMVLLAPSQGLPLTTDPQFREAQARASEQLVTEGLTDNQGKPPPEIDLEAVADKVYRLMQSDLVLERERATRLGG